MATETIRFQFRSGVATLTADVYPAESDTVAVSGRACTEATNAKTWYTFTVVTGETGLHRIVIKDSSQTPQEIGSMWCLLTGTAVTVETYDDYATVSKLLGTLAAGTHNPQSGDGYAYLGTNLGALGANATEAGGTGDHLTALGTAAELAKVPKSDGTSSWNATALAAIQQEAEDALVANNLDHLCKTATAAADMTTEVADNTILARILANGDTSAFDPSVHGLYAISVDIGAPTSVDGSAATLAGMLLKVFDDNGGADYDATTDSLEKLPTTNADAVLARNVSNVEATAPEHSLCTIVLACLEGSRTASAWTIKRTDGVSTHATKTITESAALNPVASVT